MKKLALLISMVLLLVSAGVANAYVMEYSGNSYVAPANWTEIASVSPVIVNPSGTGLNHAYYYTWALSDLNLSAPIPEMRIVFHNMYNSNDDAPDALHVYLFDNVAYSPSVDGVPAASLGWNYISDGAANPPPNWNTGWSEYLGTWSDPTDSWYTRYDVVFSTTNPSVLAYLQNGGSFVIGIDPDCAYVPDKITVEVPVPEPATMLLLGAGLVGLAGFGRKKLLRKRA